MYTRELVERVRADAGRFTKRSESFRHGTITLLLLGFDLSAPETHQRRIAGYIKFCILPLIGWMHRKKPNDGLGSFNSVKCLHLFISYL